MLEMILRNGDEKSALSLAKSVIKKLKNSALLHPLIYYEWQENILLIP